jgi:chorismate-pyruvate lyase
MSNREHRWHLMRALSERLLSANSVTEELERWCLEVGISRGRIVAICDRSAKIELLDEESLKALHAYPHAKPEFRRVQLSTDGIVIVDALNWYFPAHLTPQICELLRNTSVPFGRAIKTLRPTRRTFLVRQCTPEQIAAFNDQARTASSLGGMAFRPHSSMNDFELRLLIATLSPNHQTVARIHKTGIGREARARLVAEP